jgi:O-acetyl-ADP-ribose deacetylase (regulator of RNase III)
MKNYQFSRTVISIIRGDITEQGVDALVNAANNHLWMGGGVAGAIKRRGGAIIEQEAIAKGPIQIGDAIFTTAGRLKAKYVIHAAVMGQDLNTDENKIRMATRNSLLLANQLKIKSVAFPALGTGVGGFSKEKCAEIMINEVISHIKQKSSLKKIIFVLFDQLAYSAFERVLDTIINHPNSK